MDSIGKVRTCQPVRLVESNGAPVTEDVHGPTLIGYDWLPRSHPPPMLPTFATWSKNSYALRKAIINLQNLERIRQISKLRGRREKVSKIRAFHRISLFRTQ